MFGKCSREILSESVLSVTVPYQPEQYPSYSNIQKRFEKISKNSESPFASIPTLRWSSSSGDQKSLGQLSVWCSSSERAALENDATQMRLTEWIVLNSTQFDTKTRSVESSTMSVAIQKFRLFFAILLWLFQIKSPLDIEPLSERRLSVEESAWRSTLSWWLSHRVWLGHCWQSKTILSLKKNEFL